MNRLPILQSKCRNQNIGILKLTGISAEEESVKIANHMIDKTWNLADVLSSSRIGWFSFKNGSVR